MTDDSQIKPVSQKKSTPDATLDGHYKYYVLFALMIGFALNFLDRQILHILLPEIKREFELSDTVLGLLSGLAFSVFYAIMGLPIASLADRKSRRNVIAVSMAVWSLFTALSSASRNFLMLFSCRVGVGVGEAGFTPSATSLIADYFPRASRTTAISIASLGIPLGTFLGLAIGGGVVETVGWRTTMMLAGLPGLFFAVLVWATIREPARGLADGTRLSTEEKVPGLLQTAGTLFRLPTFRYIVLGAGLSSFSLLGISSWMPSLLSRSYGMPISDVGLWLGIVTGSAGAVGLLLSGFVTDKLSQRDARWAVWLPGMAALLAVPVTAAAFLSDSIAFTLGLYGISYLLGICFNSPVAAAIQAIVPLNMRSSGIAWNVLMINLVGLGTGPLCIGLLSEELRPIAAGESLRYAMFLPAGVYLLAAICFALAARNIKAEPAH